MIDISGRAMRAGIRSITAVATATCFAVMPQVAGSAYAHTGGKAARAHDHATPHRDHDGREARDQGRDPVQGREPVRGRADVVVDTRGPRGAIVPGRTYKWPFEVTNRGSVPARDVALTARPDRSLKVLAAPPKCRWRHTGPLVCRIGLLPQGQTRRGEITATVVPRARSGKALNNPIQVSWRNAPNAEQRMSGGFPPVQVTPGDDIPAPGADGAVPYPLTVTERGPVTSESVVVRSPIGLPAPEGPCANGVAPATIAGKAMPIKPAFDSCGAKLDDASACGCLAPHDRPAAAPAADDAAPPDRPATTPCGAAADRPVVTGDDAVPPCALGRPGAEPGRPAATTPCGAAMDRPVVTADDAAPPCALDRPATEQGRPATAPSEPPADRPAAGTPASTPCDASRPVILPAPVGPASVPDLPAAPPCAGGQNGPAAEQGKPAAAPTPEVNGPATTCGADAAPPVIVPGQPVTVPAAPATPPCAQGRPAAAPSAPALDRPSIDKPVADTVDKPEQPALPAQAATPCGAAATAPVLIPGRPVTVPDVPAVPPCAQARPGCGCQAAQTAPAAVSAPAAPAADAGVPSAPDAAPCAAADKPMAADGKTTEERPAGPSCGAEAPAVVHEEPGVAPSTIAPMTPQVGLGKAAVHRPLRRPHHHAGIPVHAPRASGRAHRDCVRQGTGFVCPLGSAPGRRPHVLNLTAPGHPHAMRCVGAAGAACHTRFARPVAVRPQPAGGRLPTTGGSSALLALSGLGLAGAGVVLYRLSRARRGDQG